MNPTPAIRNLILGVLCVAASAANAANQASAVPAKSVLVLSEVTK